MPPTVSLLRNSNVTELDVTPALNVEGIAVCGNASVESVLFAPCADLSFPSAVTNTFVKT